MSMDLVLTRYGSVPNLGTFGELWANTYRFYTIEREWKDNQNNISCVPPGKYDLESFDSTRFGRTWCLVNHSLGVYKYNTNGRFAILFHPANYATDLAGCIGVGKDIMNNPKAGVTNSNAAFGKLKLILDNGCKNTLEIQWRHL